MVSASHIPQQLEGLCYLSRVEAGGFLPPCPLPVHTLCCPAGSQYVVLAAPLNGRENRQSCAVLAMGQPQLAQAGAKGSR